MLNKLRKALRWERRNGEKGQGLPEYALLLIIVVIACAAALSPVGDSVKGVGDSVSAVINSKVSELQTP